MAKNKVRYGLKNVHYAIIDENEDGTLAYHTPVKWPGAVNLSLEAQGDPAEFYADNGVYFNAPTNNGYDGTLEMALIPDEFRQQVLAETLENGVQIENGNAKNFKKFALLFEFDADIRARRHVIYYCSASRPTEEGGTVEDTIEPQTTELEFQSRKRPDNGYVKARCTDDAPDNIYEQWYDAVYGADTVVAPTGITLNNTASSVQVGADVQLTATVTPENATDKSVRWSSSDTGKATVDSSGKVHGVAAGTVAIIAELAADPAKQAVNITTITAAG